MQAAIDTAPTPVCHLPTPRDRFIQRITSALTHRRPDLNSHQITDLAELFADLAPELFTSRPPTSDRLYFHHHPGPTIQHLRLEQSLSRVRLSILTNGITPNTLINIEHGHSKSPGWQTILTILSKLGYELWIERKKPQ